MNKLLLLLSCCLTFSLSAQELEILIVEEPPYRVTYNISVEVYLINNTNDTIVYFDSRGSKWNSFKEEWSLNVTGQSVEILPMNGAHDGPFPDSTIITLYPGDTNLTRTTSINLEEMGDYSLTYQQSQAPEFVRKDYADSDSTYLSSKKITRFEVLKNIQFKVLDNPDTIIHEIIDMSWEEWEDFRHIHLYSKRKHFDDYYEALKRPQDVYSLIYYCNGLSDDMIKRIGEFKNLKALTLRQYELDYYPKELADLNLYELRIFPRIDSVISFPDGVSTNNTIRELSAKFYGGFPEEFLSLKHLKYLEIKDCPIKTLPDLSVYTDLEVLIANNIEINTIKHSGFQQLKKLKDLNLSGNKDISDLTPLLECTNLEFLVLNRTSIPAIPNEIENLSKLKKLSISNKITHISDSIGNLSNMRYLSFGGNRKLDSIPNSILKMTKLLHFDVSSTNIPVLPEGIVDLPLEKLLIYNTDCEITKDYKTLKKRLGDKFKE